MLNEELSRSITSLKLEAKQRARQEELENKTPRQDEVVPGENPLIKLSQPSLGRKAQSIFALGQSIY